MNTLNATASPVLATMLAVFCAFAQMLWRSKVRWVVLAAVSLLIAFSMTLTLLNALYPVTVEDFFINQGFISVRPQALPSQTFSARGLREIGRSSVTFLGVARNVKSRIPHVLPQLEALAGLFYSSQAIFVEGDSTDGTAALLAEWASRSPSNRTILQASAAHLRDSTEYGFEGQAMPREGRIAAARNAGLRHMLQAQAHAQAQAQGKHSSSNAYTIVVDLDIKGFNLPGVLDSFGRSSSSWDVMCSHGIILQGLYRDSYALRAPFLGSSNHHLHGEDHLLYNLTAPQARANRQAYQRSKRKIVQMLDQTRLSVDDRALLRPLQVDSCFGGLAIYRSAVLANCSYDHRDALPPHMLDCEHVHLHRCLRDKHHARIFSNPHMKLWYGHSEMEFLVRLIRNLLR